MAYSNTVEIIPERMTEELKKRGLTNYSKLSDELGHSTPYIGRCIKEGRMALPSLKLLQQLYGIRIEDVTEQPQEQELNHDALGRIVRQSVFEGIDAAISYEKLSEIIRQSVFDGVWAALAGKEQV